jgi:MFS superfamily sulfate permease-like transporter
VAAGDVARFGALAAALAILVGLVLALLGLLHLGFVSRFISAGVQAGFMFGLGLTIIIGQVVAGIAVAALFGLAGHGSRSSAGSRGPCPAWSSRRVGWHDLVALLPGALAIAIIGYAESATVAEYLADEHGYTVRPDRELLAIGGPTSSPACSRGSSPAAGPASRPPTTAPAPPAGVPARLRADRAHRGRPAAAVPRPPPGRPRGDRDRRRGRGS